MPNITISLDEELLKSGRRYAEKHRIIKEAIDCSIINRLSFWDALIVTAAEGAKCEKIWSEDLNDGQVVRGVRIENPLRI